MSTKNSSKSYFYRIQILATIFLNVFIIAYVAQFYAENEKRIVSTTVSYSEDAAELTVEKLNQRFDGLKNELRTIVNLFSSQIDEVDATPVEYLDSLTESSVFDRIEFTTVEGLDYYNSICTPIDVSDRDYYINGMMGRSGIDVIMDSRVSGNRMLAFYRPIVYGGKILGIMLGFVDEDTVSSMIGTDCFGEAAECYIFAENGKIFARNITGKGTAQRVNPDLDTLPVILGKKLSAYLDETESGIRNALEQDDKYSFSNTINRKETAGTIQRVKLEGDKNLYFMQIFPEKAATAMITRANQSSNVLIVRIVTTFILYLVIMFIIWAGNRRELRRENEDISKIVTSVTQIYDSFLVIDLEEGSCEHFIIKEDSETPQRETYQELLKTVNDKYIMDKNPDGLTEVFSEESIQKALDGGRNFVSYDGRIRNSSKTIWKRISLISLERKENKVVKVLMAREDVTALRTEQQKQMRLLEEAMELADNASRAKSEFLSNMSHDIRTPMNAVVGFTTLLAKDAGDEEKVRKYTRKIAASSQLLLGLINDILDMSKIESGKTSLNLSEENLSEIIEEIDTIVRPQMKAREHTFEIIVKGIQHEDVVVDKLRLNQILLNLLSNTMKYTPDGGYVILTLEELKQHSRQYAHYRISVADNGVGMSPEYVEKVFDVFSRESDSTTSRIQGTGLGMAITKKLVDLMGGNITVQSELNKGTTFTVELELHICERDIDEQFWKKNGIFRTLVVDDEEDICKNIQSVMDKTGVEVEYALDGNTAIMMIRQSEIEKRLYNVVLLDWKMPGMSGLETARRIRKEIPKEVPILILTSYDWTEIEDEAREAGIDAFLPKPFFLTSFRYKLDRIINEEHQHQKDWERNQESPFKGMHILLVEDNDLNSEIATELLAMCGATVRVCKNGKLAVETFEKSVPGEYQIILMDIQMPVMNGYEAARAIRQSSHSMAESIPIVAMTANAYAEDIRHSLDAGMDAHVSKPIDMEVLEETVGEILKRKK